MAIKRERLLDSDSTPSPSTTPKKIKPDPESLPSTPPPPNSNSAFKSKSKAKARIPSTPTPTKDTGPAGNPKARIDPAAKQLIGEEIIERGIAGLDVDDLSKRTGLTKQQIASQLIRNRNNLRKQMMELVSGL